MHPIPTIHYPAARRWLALSPNSGRRLTVGRAVNSALDSQSSTQDHSIEENMINSIRMDEEGTEIPVKAPTTEFVFSLLVRLQTPMTETGPGSSAKFTCGGGDVRIVSTASLQVKHQGSIHAWNTRKRKPLYGVGITNYTHHPDKGHTLSLSSP